jgi:hypothetical protein
MSRRRSAPGVHHVEQVARELLDGHVRPGAKELLDCIHAINPTGRALGAADERRRYELKARLQSLLIRNFAEELVVVPDAPGVVSIRHRYLGQDACHAPIDELDDDARARVRWLLDTAVDPDPAHDGTPGSPSGPVAAGRDPLAPGRAALAEFDYETARAHFEAAALRANGDPAAARELLELLVDHMALDQDALALEDRLTSRAASDPDVRALLAVAAARSGDTARAHRLLNGLAVPRATDARHALAEDALRREAIDDLERCLARLSEADPTHPELVRLRGELQRLRSEARRPAEQQLLLLSEAGDDSATEAAARALLARWPDSPVAGRVLSRIQDHQRAAEAARLVASARAALSDGAIERATELARRARSSGAETAALLDEIRAADEAQRRARDAAEVAAVGAQLAGADPRPGLAAFLALDPELRKRVRSQVESPVLDWLEQAVTRNRGARPGALIDAVLAIPAAADALDRDEDERALAILEPHARALAGLARAGELQADARRRIAARRRAAAAAALDEAQRALAGGDLDLCDRRCEQADGRDLDAALRPRLDQVRRDARERRATARSLARVDQLVASGDLVTARRELEALLAGPLATEQVAALRTRCDELRAQLWRTWCVRSDGASQPHNTRDPIGELLGRFPYIETIAPWVLAEGRELAIASAYGRHVFFGRVAVDDGRLLDRHYLRAPEPLGPLISTTVDGDTLWLIGETGRVLQASWRTGEPVRWASLTPFLIGDERLERAFLIPGAGHLWLEMSEPGRDRAQRVIEIEGWRLRREFPDSRSIYPVLAGAASCVIGLGLDTGAVRYTDRGAVADELAAFARMRVTAVAVDPGGDLVALGSLSGDDDHDGLEIARVQSGRLIRCQTLAETSYETSHRCAAARDAGLLAIHHWIERDRARLSVFRFADRDLAPVYAVDVPVDCVLAQDREAAQVVALWDRAPGIEVTRIAAQPPPFGDATASHLRWFLPPVGDFMCGAGVTDGGGVTLVAVADAAARRGAWEKVREVLEPVPLDRVAPHWIAHHCHLLGIAWLRTGGDAARVRELWQRGQAHESEERVLTCRLGECLELLEPMPDPLPEAWWSSEATVLRQLRGAIATADRLLEAGDPRAALEVMRRRVVTGSHELQSAARLAAAWLANDPRETPEHFDKAIALARFVVLAAQPTTDLPIEGAWSRDQLAAVASDAERWLATWHERLCPRSEARRSECPIEADCPRGAVAKPPE